MRDEEYNEESSGISVSDDNHPLASIKHFFSNQNNVFISTGVLLSVTYFLFTFVAVKVSLQNAGNVVRYNQSLAREYHSVKNNNSEILFKLDSLDNNKFDVVLLDSIKNLRDSSNLYKTELAELRTSINELMSKVSNKSDELSLAQSDIQQKSIYIQQLKTQQNYNENFYASLTNVNDSLSMHNYRLKSRLKSLEEQLNATAIQTK